MKKLVGILLVGLMCLGLVGCGSNTNTNINTEDKQKVEQALEKLKNLQEGYMIATTLQAPDGNISYIEVVSPEGFSYTEYPVDGDGNLGVLNTEDMATNEYTLTDWLDSDGTFYLVNSDDTNLVYTLPKTYATRVSSRKYGYLDVMMDRFTEFKYYKDTTANIGLGDESLSLYRCTLPSDVVKTIVGIGSYGLYDSIKTDYQSNSNLVKLCDFYLKDLDMNLTFSDAIVTIGLVDDSVRYLSIEVGGLGTRMYLTKTFLPLRDTEIKSRPDFSNSEDYVVTLQNLADFVSKYDSYEDAIDAINNGEFDVKEDNLNKFDATSTDSTDLGNITTEDSSEIETTDVIDENQTDSSDNTESDTE